MRKPCRTRLLATFVLVILFGSVGGAGGAEPRPIPTTAIMLTQQQIAEQHLQFSFGDRPAGVCGYVPNVVAPQITGVASAGATLFMNGGSWQPSCGGGLSQADIRWWSGRQPLGNLRRHVERSRHERLRDRDGLGLQRRRRARRRLPLHPTMRPSSRSRRRTSCR